MKLRTLNRLAFTGFLLLYFAGVGSLVVLVMPILDRVQGPLLRYVMLPVGILGLAVAAFEKMHKPEDA